MKTCSVECLVYVVVLGFICYALLIPFLLIQESKRLLSAL